MIALLQEHEAAMTITDYDRKVDELDQLLNDPFVPMRADRIWDLLADICVPLGSPAGYEAPSTYSAFPG